jgi:hypothetical protein
LLIVLSSVAIGGHGCGSIDQAVNRYLDGCRDVDLFLDRESLQQVDEDPVILGPIEFQAPKGAYARAGRDQVSIFQGVYCDSGDWGVDIGNQVRVKLYDGPAPASLYEDLPGEQVRPLETMADPRGSLHDEIVVDGRKWTAQLELWGGLVPSIRTAYLTTVLGSQTLAVSFVAEIGAAADPSLLVTVVESLREADEGT